MKNSLKKTIFFASLVLAILPMSCSKQGDKNENKHNFIKIGTITKSFPNTNTHLEIDNAVDQFAAKHNLEIIETVSNTNKEILENIDYLQSNGVKGIIISNSIPELGPAIESRTKRYKLKVIAINNRFVNTDGTYSDSIPFVGISPEELGNNIVKAVLFEIKRKKWNPLHTGILFLKDDTDTVYYASLKTAENKLINKGFTKNNILYQKPAAQDNISFSSLNLSKINSEAMKNIIIFGSMQNNVFSLMKSLKKYKPDKIAGFGIEYTKNFSNQTPANYFGKIFLDPKKYALTISETMYNWIVNDEKPKPTTYINSRFIPKK